MQVSVEKISDTERRLTISVPTQLMEEAFDKQIKQFAKSANLKGFRPGKTPVSYVKQRFGNEARREALGDIIKSALQDALNEHNLRPINTPEIQPKQVAPEQDIEFVASFEVLPTIEEIKCSLESIEKYNVSVTSVDVDSVLEQLRKQFAEWKKTERAAKNGDRLVIDYTPMLDGKLDQDSGVKNHTLELGSEMMIPGFEAGLLDAKVNDERTLNLVFPDDYSDAQKAGKPVSFVVQVKQVLEASLPELNEAFVKRLGIKTGALDDLRTQIQKSLEQERDRLVMEKVKGQVFDALIEQNHIEIPKSLIEQEAKSIHNELHSHYGEHHHDTDEDLTHFRELAKKRVGLSLLISEFANQNRLKADHGKVKQRIQQIASAYEKPDEVLEWLSQGERLQGIEAQVLEDQVIEKLIEKLTVLEKEMTFAELKGSKI